MFGVKMESAAVCRGCLSADRKLSSLTSNKSYLNLLPNQQIQEAWRESEVRLCWECKAALKRMQLFQAQAQKAHVVLELSSNYSVSLRCLSTLTTCHKDSYDATFHEIEDKETPIKKEKLSFESGDETNEDYYNDNDDDDDNENDDIDHLEVDADQSFKEDTMTKELRVTRKKPLSVLKNEQQTEKKRRKLAVVINTNIKVKSLEENEIKTRRTIMKRPPSSRTKKPVLKKDIGSQLKKKKKLKRAASPVKFREGFRKSKRISGIEPEEIESSNEGHIENNYVYVAVPKEDNANDCDTAFRDDVDLRYKGGAKNETVKANKLDLLKTENASNSGNSARDDYTHSKDGKEQSEENGEEESNELHSENANDSGNEDRDNMHTHSKDGKSENLKAVSCEVLEENEEDESIEVNWENANDSDNDDRDYMHTDSKDGQSLAAASGGVAEQSEESEEEEVNLNDFTRTIVDYHYDDLDKHFTKVELSEEETGAALEQEPAYVTLEWPYDCVYCGLRFELNRTMEKHVKGRHHQLRKDVIRVGPNAYYRERMYRCDHCAVVMRGDLAAAHMKYAHRIKYQCKHCDKDFWNKADCKEHMTTNHSRFDCDLCEETQPSFKLLERHKRRAHKVRKPKKREETAQCEECGKELCNSFALVAHQEMRHPRDGSDPQYHCAPCNRTMRSKRHYHWHMKYDRTHNPKVVQKFPCPQCGKMFDKLALKRHYDRFHTDRTDFQCKICGKYYARNGGLKYHHRRFHMKIPLPKNTLCTICGRYVSNKRVLMFHMRTHTGERPYKCSLCPAAFAQPYPLKKHSETQHGRRDTTRATTPHTHSDVHSQSLVEVPVEPRSHDEVIIEWPVQDEVIIETLNQDGEMSG